MSFWTAENGGEGGGEGGGASPPPPPPPPAADGGQGGAPPAFYEAFTRAELKTNPSVQNFKTVEDLAHGYVNLEKRFGIEPNRRIDLPADMNDAAAMRAVYAKLGLPEKAEGYGFKLDDKATDADKAFLGRATEALHKAGLPAGQAKAVFEYWMGEVQAAETARVEAFQAQAAEGKAALQKEWGQAYDTKAKEIGAAVLKYGDENLVKELNADGLGNYPNLARMLGKMLDRMAEPGAAGGQGGDADRGDRPLTPAQAAAQVRTLEGDPVKGAALRDRNHPQHKAVVAERVRLLAMTDEKAA